MKGNSNTAFDNFIINFATHMAQIPNYENIIKDDDLKKLHTFVAVGITGIHDATNMVIGSFIPAANRLATDTRTQIQRSKFKDIINQLKIDPNIIQQETIRLGYVFVFHKFEVFVKQLIDIMDETLGNVSTPLRKYAKSKFNFVPTEWYRNSAIHLVNFISNCTKHQDGLCRLDNPTYSIPKEFAQQYTDSKIVRSTQQFKADIKGLVDAIGPLIEALNAIFIYRTFESIELDSKANKSEPEDQLMTIALANMEIAARTKINLYQNN
ncbi:hypothetical protein ABIC45_005074 [Mucilaginibacter rubeus]|uniref:hypothetical protein n=1 Tax=Mucilaginibacter rubeus TaxID=2027860 RepID=UPI00339536DF